MINLYKRFRSELKESPTLNIWILLFITISFATHTLNLLTTMSIFSGVIMSALTLGGLYLLFDGIKEYKKKYNKSK